MTYRFIHGTSPSCLQSCFTRVTNMTFRRRLLSFTSHRLEVPPVRLSTVDNRAFPVSGATVWNDLPLHVVSAPSLAVFRQRLKTFPFSRFIPRHLTISYDCMLLLPFITTAWTLVVLAVSNIIWVTLYDDDDDNDDADIDECSREPPICSQLCNNTASGFSCSCVPGYSLSNDRMHCVALPWKNGAPFLIYAQQNGIYQISVSHGTSALPSLVHRSRGNIYSLGTLHVLAHLHLVRGGGRRNVFKSCRPTAQDWRRGEAPRIRGMREAPSSRHYI